MAEEEKTKTALEEAKEILVKIEEAKKDNEELLGRMEAIKAEKIISGKADAGKTVRPIETEDEKITRESNEYLIGTGLKI